MIVVRRADIGATSQALEPELHRLISGNRTDLRKRREAAQKWCDERREELEGDGVALLNEDRKRVDEELQEKLTSRRRACRAPAPHAAHIDRPRHPASIYCCTERVIENEPRPPLLESQANTRKS